MKTPRRIRIPPTTNSHVSRSCRNGIATAPEINGETRKIRKRSTVEIRNLTKTTRKDIFKKR